MAEPMVLFRSMALSELVEIMRTGKIVGGGNFFHEGDDRPYVFFGDELNETLLGNGESLDRCAAMILRNHEIQTELADAANTVRWHRKALTRAIRRDGIECEKFDVWAFRSSGDHWPLIRSVTASRQIDRKRYALLLAGYANALRTRGRTEAKHYALLRYAFSEVARRTVAQQYTSAVIVTHPVTGGLEYRDEIGISLNCGEPEYGFRPGQLTIADVAQVLLVKNGKVAQSLRPERFAEIEPICHSAMAVTPAEEVTMGWKSRQGASLTATCRSNGEIEWSVHGDIGQFATRVPWLLHRSAFEL